MQCYEVNMDNYRCYLSTRVQNFKSSGQDLTREEPFILRVHHLVSAMETWMLHICDCDLDVDVTFSFHTCLVCELDLGKVGFSGSLGSSSSSQLFFED